MLAQYRPVSLGGGALIAAVERCPGQFGGGMLRPGGLLLHGGRQRTRFVPALVDESGGPESEEKPPDVRHHRHALARVAHEAEHLSGEPETAPQPGRDQERASPDPPDHVRHADALAGAPVAERAHAGGDRARGARHHHGRSRVDPEVRERGHHPAREVEGAEEAASPEILQQGPDQVEEEHVPEDVHPSEVQEHVREPTGLQKSPRRDQAQPAHRGRLRRDREALDQRVEMRLLERAGRFVDGDRRLLVHLLDGRPRLGTQIVVDEPRLDRQIRVLLVVPENLPEAIGAHAVRVPRRHPGEQERGCAGGGDADGYRGDAVHLCVLDAHREEQHGATVAKQNVAGNVGRLG